MNEFSAKEIAAGSTKVSSWVPQVYFDLIARVIPGSLALGIVGMSLVGVDESLFLVSKWLDKNLGFPSILIILVTIIGLSYSYAVSVWGLWYGVFPAVRRIYRFDEKADRETFVVLEDRNYADVYEEIKTSNPVAGNRLTKLKAEIHMAGTLITTGIGSLIIICVQGFIDSDSKWFYLVTAIVVAIVGLSFALKHFVRRSTQIVTNAETICGK